MMAIPVPGFKALVRRLFPTGTSLGKHGYDAPEWPPDLFAYAATAAEQFGIYAKPPFIAGWQENEYIFTDEYLENVRDVCRSWSKRMQVPQPVSIAWRRLMGRMRRPPRYDWHRDVIFLLIVSDTVCEGIGFDIEFDIDDPPRYVVAQFVFSQIVDFQFDRRKNVLLRLPHSLCIMAVDSEICVQPKTSTPKVGCTLRSLTHHLALLPSRGVVRTAWSYAAPASEESSNFNTLLVPFPYRINASDFQKAGNSFDRDNQFFVVKQGWLEYGGKPISAGKIVRFLGSLIDAARGETDDIHAIVLPELALSDEHAEMIAEGLARRYPKLELFVAGVLEARPGRSIRNSAFMACLLRSKIAQCWRQPKHHRWRLESSQISRYNLGAALDPEKLWWEKIDISDRQCWFTVIRPGASFATLVCEDLARADPIMPVINAIGPNLLVALLMDGPQWERRWPGRYATALADDPGTSVLTLTSIGMINRSTEPGQASVRQIALWKQAGGLARELTLPQSEHALLLSLTLSTESQMTMDRRSDGGLSQQFRLSGVRGVRLDSKKLPPWIRM